MKVSLLNTMIAAVCWTSHCSGKIMRNRALLTKMISNFHDGRVEMQQETPAAILPQPSPIPTSGAPEVQLNSHVISVMQSVLCRNFPAVPCDVITHDPTLKNLIMSSIAQIMKKKGLSPSVPLAVQHQLYFHEAERQPRVKVYRKIGLGADYKKVKHWNREKDLPLHQEPKLVKIYPARNKNVYTLKTKLKHHNNSEIVAGRSNTWRKDVGVIEDRLSISDEGASEVLNNGIRNDINPPIWHLDYYKTGTDKANEDAVVMNPGPLVSEDDNEVDSYKARISSDFFVKNSLGSKHFASDGND